MPKLIVTTPSGASRHVRLEGAETRIGRASANDLVLDVERVSRFHAVVTVDGAFVTIQDLESRNGTSVNGERVRSQMLVDGDTILIGGCEMRFLGGDESQDMAGNAMSMHAGGPPAGLEPLQ